MARYLDGLEGITFEYVGTFSASNRRALRATLDEILRCLAALRDGLGLRKKRMHLRRAFEARLSRVWETLEESRARQLRGYGNVPEELGAYLDPRVDELLDLTKRLQEILRGEGES